MTSQSGDGGLKQRTLRALYWSFAESMGLQAVRFGIGVILARALLPEDFGLMGMLLVFIVVTQSLFDGGFSSALIQKKDSTDVDNCSVFYLNALTGIVLGLVLWIGAPWVADFYAQPILRDLLRVLTLAIVLNSLGLVQYALLEKAIDFKTQFKVSLLAAVPSGAIGITMAIAGFGVWSLAAQHVANAFFRLIILWVASDWRPSLQFSFASLRGMSKFGSLLMVSAVLNQTFDALYYVVIGRLFSAGELGLFTRAKTLQELPSGMLSVMVGRVTFPVFSSLQDDPKRMGKGLRRAVMTIMMVNVPVMLGMAAIAEPLVLILLGSKWLPCVRYFQLFCLIGLLFPLQLMNLNVLRAMGRSDLFLRLEVIKKALVVLCILFTWQHGVVGLIWGMLATSVAAFGVNAAYSGTLVGYPISRQLWDTSPYLIASLLMAIGVFAVAHLGEQRSVLMLGGQVLFGVAFYLTLCRIFRLEAFMDALAELIKVAGSLRAPLAAD